MKINVKGIKNRLLVKYPTFGSIIANTDIVENKSIRTAGTDAEKIYYNPDFIGTLSEDEQLFVFAHEVCHIALDHIYRSEGRDKELWNIATDAVSNSLLEADGLPIPKGGVNMPKAINYTAEQIYSVLVQNKNKQSGDNGESNENSDQTNSNNQSQSSRGSSNNQNGSNSSSSGGGAKDNKDELSDMKNPVGSSGSGSNSEENSKENDASNGGANSNKIDDLDDKKKENGSSSKNDIEEKNNENGAPSDSGSKTDKKDGGESSSEGNNSEEKSTKNKDVGHDTHSLWEKAIEKKKQSKTQNKDTHQKDEKDSNGDKKSQEKDETIKELSKLKEKEVFEKNKKERKKMMEKLKQKMAKQAGNSTNEDNRYIDEIGKESKYIDWRLLLKETIKFEIDWSYKNATIEDGVVTPHLEEEPRPETEIVLDTSGSIDEELLKGFLKECKNIIKTSNVKVGCFDTKFYGFKEIRTEKDIDNYNFKGGGGTNFEVAVEAFSKRVENKIIFTDGEADMPSLKIDAIWVVFGGTKINPKGGKVIYISDEQLDRIYSYKNKCTRSGR